MNVHFIQCVTNVWPAEEFHEHVDEAVRIVLTEEPSASREAVRKLVLMQWLAHAYPAGSA